MSDKSSDKSYVCRCEDVTLADVRQLIEKGLHTVEEMKRVTRCTMGACQGRTCRNLVAQEIACQTGLPVADMDVPTFRAPVKPIKLGKIAGGEEDA